MGVSGLSSLDLKCVCDDVISSRGKAIARLLFESIPAAGDLRRIPQIV